MSNANEVIETVIKIGLTGPVMGAAACGEVVNGFARLMGVETKYPVGALMTEAMKRLWG